MWMPKSSGTISATRVAAAQGRARRRPRVARARPRHAGSKAPYRPGPSNSPAMPAPHALADEIHQRLHLLRGVHGLGDKRELPRLRRASQFAQRGVDHVHGPCPGTTRCAARRSGRECLQACPGWVCRPGACRQRGRAQDCAPRAVAPGSARKRRPAAWRPSAIRASGRQRISITSRACGGLPAATMRLVHASAFVVDRGQ